MAYRNEGPFTITAGEALARDRFFKLSSGVAYYCDAGENADGITSAAIALGAKGTAYPIKGTIERVTASKIIAVNTGIYHAADGKVSDAAVGKAIGKTLDQAAGADGGIIPAIVWGSRGVNSSAADSKIYVSPDGDDTENNGSILAPYLTITAALAAVTTSRKTIMLLSGEYVEALALVWPNVTGVSINGFGGDVTITGTAGQTEVILINPTFSASTFEATLSNLTISAPDGVKGIVFDNQNTTGRKYNLYLKNVGIDADTATDQSLDVVHTTTTQAMRVYCEGTGRSIIEGLVYIAPQNTDDRFWFTGMQFDGGIQFGTATIASLSVFKNCIMKDAGGSGGQDTQIIASLNCHSLTGTTLAIAALNDFAANAAEVILPAA